VLQLKLSVEQSVQDPNILYVTDVTPAYSATTPGGYGAPNLTRNQITHVVFRLTTPSGHSYYTDPFNWQSGTHALRASQFSEEADSVFRSGHGCQYFDGHLDEIADGLYDLSFEAYALTGIPTQTANYHLELALKGEEQVWVLKNNVWVNLTPLGSFNQRGKWEYTVLDTVDRYDGYELRRYGSMGGYDVCTYGQVTVVMGPSPTSPTSTSTIPRLVAATTGRVLFTQRVTRRLAIVIKAMLVNLKPNPLVGRMYPEQAETLLNLYTAQQILEDVQKAGSVDTRLVAEQLTDVNQQVAYLENMSVWNKQAVTHVPSKTFYQ
jgi:hypothetical protein